MYIDVRNACVLLVDLTNVGQIWIICNKFQEKDRRILFPLVCLLPLRKTIACGHEHRGLNLCGQTKRVAIVGKVAERKYLCVYPMGRYTG